MLHSYPPPMGRVGCQQGLAPADKLALQPSSTLASLPVCPAPITTPYPAVQLSAFRGHGDCLFRRHLITAEPATTQHKETVADNVMLSWQLLVPRDNWWEPRGALRVGRWSSYYVAESEVCGSSTSSENLTRNLQDVLRQKSLFCFHCSGTVSLSR